MVISAVSDVRNNYTMNTIEILRDMYKTFSRIQWRGKRFEGSYQSPINLGG